MESKTVLINLLKWSKELQELTNNLLLDRQFGKKE